MKRLLLPLLLPLLAATAFAQGPLAPPNSSGPQVGPVAPLDGSGNPQPTMKTLHQVEPRTPVQTLAVSAPYTISQPGSYYLTGNITVASGDAIVIASDDVSLDLNGFTLKSTYTGGSSGTAVSVSSSRSRLTIRNGSIVGSTVVPASGSATAGGFVQGIYSNGIITQALVSGIHVTGVAGDGIYLDVQGLIERCTVTHCGGGGIFADEVRDCSVKKCYGTAITALGNASNCTGSATGSGKQGLLISGNATNCTGIAINGDGLSCIGNATNCSGISNSGFGLTCSGNAMNCSGNSTTGTGLSCTGNATNCTGTSASTGLFAVGNATNCIGITTGNSDKGLWCGHTATSCYGQSPGGGTSATALKAAIAIGCTYTLGTSTGIDVPLDKRFNM